jgi:hypothetical protein
MTGKHGKLHEQQRQTGEAHAPGLAVKPGKGRFAEFENQLALAELQCHAALLGAVGYLNKCNVRANRAKAKVLIKTQIKQLPALFGSGRLGAAIARNDESPTCRDEAADSLHPDGRRAESG